MITNLLVKTYWIESPALRFLGLGVTAFSRDDTFQLLSASGYPLSAGDPWIRVTEGIEVADLDQNHIIPNMGSIVANTWTTLPFPGVVGLLSRPGSTPGRNGAFSAYDKVA